MARSLVPNPVEFKAFLESRPRLILGSNSCSRKTLFTEMSNEHNFKYEIATADIDEKSIRHTDPSVLVVELGYAKAKAIVDRSSLSWNDEIFLITGDQVVVHEGRILEKPESEEEVYSNAKRYSQTPAQTVGSVVCTHWPSFNQVHKVDIATIYMNELPNDVISQLISEGDVLKSAGGLVVEHPLVSPYVTRIDGGLDSVMGLRKASVMSLLVELWKKVT